jgi:predicted Zn-dependent peptidase
MRAAARSFAYLILGALMSVATVAIAAETPPLRVAVPPFERVVLDNGLTLLLMERREIPLIGFQALLRGGALADPQGKEGAASQLALLLEKGAADRDAFAFADAIAAVGGNWSTEGGLEAIAIAGDFLARDQELMIELLADLLQRPRLEPAEFEKLREREIELIRAAKDADLSGLLPIYGAAAIFGEHAYARAVGGSERSLEGLTHDDVIDYYRQHVGADRLILAITGDFDSAALRRQITEAFGEWGRARAPAPQVQAPARIAGRKVLLVDAPSSVQTYFSIGNVGVSRKYPERATLDVVNTLFGGRFTSMLNSELRIRTGLTYGVRSQLARPTQPGAWQISSFTRTDATEQAVDLALDVFAKLKSGAVDATALESGKTYVIGQFPTQLETAAQWAGQLAQLEFYALDRSYVEEYGPALGAVTLDSAARVTADVYPASDDLVFVFVGDASAIRNVVKKYGPVTEMKLSAPVFAPELSE